MQRPDISIQTLGEQTVIDALGASIPLSSLWENRTAALVFVRHFG